MAKSAAIGNLKVGMLEADEARFSTLTVDRLKANQIEGLDLLLAGIKSQTSGNEATQSAQLTDLATMIASNSAQIVTLNNLLTQATASADLSQNMMFEQDQIKVLKALSIDNSATVKLDMDVLGKLTVGELHVKSATIFDGIVQVIESITTRNLIVTDWARFLSDVLFKGDVNFEGRTTFNKDTAGGALIKKDADSVDVVFDKEYAQVPLVTISITLNEQVSDSDKATLSPADLTAKLDAEAKLEQDILNGDIKYIVTKRTTKGFTIKLNKPAPADVNFSWTALAVKDARLAVSSGSAVLAAATATPSATMTPVPSPTLVPTPAPTPVITPTPVPTPTPLPLPTPIPSPAPPKIISINTTEIGFLRVREGPDTSYAEVGQVNIGATFEVFEESSGWYEIQFEPGKYGWVSGTYVTVQ